MIIIRLLGFIFFILSVLFFMKIIISKKFYAVSSSIILASGIIIFGLQITETDKPTEAAVKCINNEIYEWSSTRKEYVPKDYALGNKGWIKKEYCINFTSANRNIKINEILFSQKASGIFIVDSMIVNKAGKDFIITDSGHKISVEQLKLIEKKIQ